MKRLILISASIVTILSVATYAYIHNAPYYHASLAQQQVLDDYFTYMDKRMDSFTHDMLSWTNTTSQYEQGKITLDQYAKDYETMIDSIHSDMALVDATTKPDTNPNSDYTSFSATFTMHMFDYQQFVKADYQSHTEDSIGYNLKAVNAINKFMDDQPRFKSSYKELKSKHYK